MLPAMFSLTFDGWSQGDTHYLAVFAITMSENWKGTTTTFWDFLRLNMSSHKMQSIISRILTLCWNHFQITVLGDNCSTNQSRASKVYKPLVG